MNQTIDMDLEEDRPELYRSLTGAEELISFGNRMINESSVYMMKILQRWQNLGEQVRRPDREDTDDLNIDTWLPLSNQQSTMPVIEDYLPTGDIVPKRKSHTLFADLYQARHDDLCEEASTRQAQLDGEQDNLTYGNGLVETITNFDDEGNFLGFEDMVRSPFEWRPSPGFTGMDLTRGEAYYHGFVTPVRREMFLIQYAADIKATKAEIAAEGAFDGQNQFQFKDVEDNPDGNNTNTVLVKRLYFLDPDIEKYPLGRYIMWCQDLLLADRPIKRRIPIFMLKNLGTPNEGMGISETSPIRSMYEALNELLSQAGDLVRKNVNPNRFIKKETLDKIEEYLDSKLGQNIPVDRAGDIEWEKSPQLGSSDIGYIELVRKMSDIASGIHDVFRGSQEYSDQPFRSVMAHQEAAEKRIRLKINREMKKLAKEMTAYKLEIIRAEDIPEEGAEGFSTIIPREDEMGTAEYITYNPSMTLGEYLKLPEFEGYAEIMEGITEEDLGLTMRDAKVGVKVTTGTLQPKGRTAREQRAIELGTVIPDPNAIYGPKQIISNLADTDTGALYKDWLDRSGWGPIKAMNDRLKDDEQEMMKEIRFLVRNLDEEKVTPGDELEAKTAEIKIRKLLQGNHLLLGSEYWQTIPPEIRGRIVVTAFAMPPQEGPGGGQQAA